MNHLNDIVVGVGVHPGNDHPNDNNKFEQFDDRVEKAFQGIDEGSKNEHPYSPFQSEVSRWIFII